MSTTLRTWLLGAVVALAAPLAAAQEKKDASSSAQAEGDLPGPVHRKLAKLAGDYATSLKFTMAGQASPETKGSATIRTILGGRFLREENTGEMMGEPVEGLRLLGYNNGAQRYEATWVYTGSTAILELSGKSADDGQTIEMEGTFTDEAGEKSTLHVTMKFVDADRFVVTLTAGKPGEGPTFETTYTRKK